MSEPNLPAVASARPNGAGAAAILAAGAGAFLFAVLAILADRSAAMMHAMNFWKPTGPLSGVTTCAMALWLAAWAVLHLRWRTRNLALGRINAVSFSLLLLGVLLTFPPIADLL